MTPMIDIAADAEGLRVAAVETLEAVFVKHFNAVMEGRTQGQMKPLDAPLRLSGGYYERVQFLIQLERMLEMHALPDWKPQPGEVSGLIALAEARGMHEAKHPPCPKCGAPLENAGTFTCWKCRAKVKD